MTVVQFGWNNREVRWGPQGHDGKVECGVALVARTGNLFAGWFQTRGMCADPDAPLIHRLSSLKRISYLNFCVVLSTHGWCSMCSFRKIWTLSLLSVR